MEVPLKLYMNFQLRRGCSWVNCVFPVNNIAILIYISQDNLLKGILLINPHFIRKKVQRD